MMKETKKNRNFIFLRKSYYGGMLSRIQEKSTHHTNIVNLILRIRFSKNVHSIEFFLTGTGEFKTGCVNCGGNVGKTVFFGTATCMYTGGEPPCRIPST